MMRARTFSPALMARAGSIVRQRTGLVFREPRRSALAAGLAAGLRRSDAAGPDEYVDRLSTEARLLDDLVGEITVGETYFFRDENQFSAIRDQILPDLRSSAGSARPLQLWSAGCATGEEAYSLAILMRERAEAARVIGTDISRRALGTARRGVYREWSLRGVPESVVRQYFRTARGRYELDRGVRDSVQFTYLNLAEAAYPSHAIGIAEMDLILCRNVLIYFDAATVARVAARLIDSLRPGGWLLVGASDPPLQDLVPCELVVTELGRAYRRPVARVAAAVRPAADHQVRRAPAPAPRREERRVKPAPTLVKPAVPPAPPPAADPSGPPDAAGVGVADLYRMRRYDEAARLAANHVEHETGDAAVWIVLVRARANRGELRLADAACLAALEHHPLNAELAYLHGVLMIEAGRAAEAVQAFRRAIYLDRTLVVAHVALGQLVWRTGSADQARRAFRNAERLLCAMPPDAVVAAADGETAARLLSLTRTQAAFAHGATP